MKQLLMFILLSGLICWMMFAPVYKHLAIMRQALLQQEVDYLLEVGASGTYGYIGESMIRQSRERLAARGFVAGDLVYEVSTTSGVDATSSASPVPRGTGIRLVIRYPYKNLFAIDRLIGAAVPDPSGMMSASGMKMSEYVPDR
jgi:hypothetical protein